MFLSIWKNGLVLFQPSQFTSRGRAFKLQTSRGKRQPHHSGAVGLPVRAGTILTVLMMSTSQRSSKRGNETVRGESWSAASGTKGALEGSYYHLNT